MMLDAVKGLGAGGTLGVILGIALVMWVAPTTAGGAGLIILMSAFVVGLTFQAVRAIVSRRSRTNGTAGEGNEPARRNGA